MFHYVQVKCIRLSNGATISSETKSQDLVALLHVSYIGTFIPANLEHSLVLTFLQWNIQATGSGFRGNVVACSITFKGNESDREELKKSVN